MKFYKIMAIFLFTYDSETWTITERKAAGKFLRASEDSVFQNGIREEAPGSSRRVCVGNDTGKTFNSKSE